jgi:threonine/homoserine efflux transporter RhtA
MAALDEISWVVVAYAALVTLVAAYSAYRWRERPPWLGSMAWMLEVLLAVRALAGLGALAAGDRPGDYATHLGYLVSSVCVMPLALRSVEDDTSVWSVGVIGVAALAVGVISVRMVMTL